MFANVAYVSRVHSVYTFARIWHQRRTHSPISQLKLNQFADKLQQSLPAMTARRESETEKIKNMQRQTATTPAFREDWRCVASSKRAATSITLIAWFLFSLQRKMSLKRSCAPQVHEYRHQCMHKDANKITDYTFIAGGRSRFTDTQPATTYSNMQAASTR